MLDVILHFCIHVSIFLKSRNLRLSRITVITSYKRNLMTYEEERFPADSFLEYWDNAFSVLQLCNYQWFIGFDQEEPHHKSRKMKEKSSLLKKNNEIFKEEL